MNTTHAIIKDYKCAVTVIEGRLHLCRIYHGGTLHTNGLEPAWTLVKPPVGQDFLAAANRALGTNFKEVDFRLDKLLREGERESHSRTVRQR